MLAFAAEALTSAMILGAIAIGFRPGVVGYPLTAPAMLALGSQSESPNGLPSNRTRGYLDGYSLGHNLQRDIWLKALVSFATSLTSCSEMAWQLP